MEPSKKRPSKGIKQNAGASYSSYIKNVFSPKVPAAAKDPNAEPEKVGRPGSKFVKEGMEVGNAYPLALFISEVQSDLTMQVRSFFVGTIIFFSIFVLLLAGEVYNIAISRSEYNKHYGQNIKLESAKKDVESKIHKINVAYFEQALNKDVDKETRRKIALRYYYYTITMNGSFIKTNSLSVNMKTVRIVISEKYTKNALDLLPESTLLLGSIFSGSDKDIASQIKAQSTKIEPRIEKLKTDDGYSYTISFDNLERGNIVTLDFGQEFQQKLALPENSVEIIYNK
jgi:hypothetical protein